MAATVSHTKNYNIAPSDGWVLIVDGTTTNIVELQIRAIPHTHPFQVFSGTVTPTTETGVRVCHKPFKAANYFNGSASKFWVKVINPVKDAPGNLGQLRLDVMSDGGVLS